MRLISIQGNELLLKMLMYADISSSLNKPDSAYT